MHQRSGRQTFFDRLRVQEETAVGHADGQRGLTYDGFEISQTLGEGGRRSRMSEGVELGGFQ
jgi:hypothetical protein